MHCGILSEHPANTRREIMDKLFGLILFCCYQSVVHLQRCPSLSLQPPHTPTPNQLTHTLPPCPFYPSPVHRLRTLCIFAVLFSTASGSPCRLRSVERQRGSIVSFIRQSLSPHLLPGPVSPPLLCAMSLFSPLCSQPSVSKRVVQNEPPKPEKQERNN